MTKARVALACFALFAAQAAGAEETSALATRIDAHVGQPRFAAASWAIEVASLDDNRIVYAHEANRLVQPASTAKLFTAALALDTLGAAYRVRTSLLASGKVRDGTLDGSLVLRGGGDPTLGVAPSSNDWPERLAAAVAQQGITRVHGDLVADDTAFQSPAAGSGWEAIDLQSYFAAPVAALNVGENVVDVTVNAATAAGRPAHVAFEPGDAAMPLNNRIATGATGSAADLNLYRAPGANAVDAFGSVPAGSPSTRIHMSVPDPARLAGERLRRALQARGVRVDGSLRAVHWPTRDAVLTGSDLREIAAIDSPPMGEILRSGLKRSQNLYLQAIWLLCGVHAPDPDAVGFTSTETHASHAMTEWLTGLGIGPATTLLEEGTGLSRRDLTTAGALVRLLVHMDGQPSAATFRDALPVAGVDGTLRGRMRGTPAEGNLRAKTGSMTFVNALAGYVTTKAGQRLAFAIVLNNYQPPDAEGLPSSSGDVDAIAVMLASLDTRM
ncbi:D-alanyl-D-alanine carboxypeptidase/D-alanyl-D-alanine-endopeptidase (penicillin-binding protein 4) [Luteibacter rhizovicinus]|uniref:D-alanyl-D-alanine carboxypeptidase/D-alanyl-D-alanine-endopeptidase (Penicillin-binding protein 4) n=1 Tax=Luteibacter rhizovicinus TaxID=242606 RepID=A0A4R3YNX8_9GAMM|nr:D-alanyl-D-alanine carboxypeptidase/D-alanyl-D-alanine-endopeptidase [Luteibacter rhizovicinus]TCV93248.1 D-alanyl-D-alanine carboxypeptidase/D-alanyl-D-alanine-endopeptidase (penicillin-binding protein 4) [Luteibacter rhizovicinus]